MPRMNIRCCCNPGKLLGSVAVPGDVKARDRVTFFLNDYGKVHLDVGVVYHPAVSGLRPEIALKSMDLGMDVLRAIPSFKEAE